MSALILLVAGAAALYFWYSSLQAREKATRTAVETCSRQGLQFLDGTVALQGLRLRRDALGRVAFQRSYQFDYSEEGASRRQGLVVLLGRHVETVVLARADAPLH